MTYTDNHGTVWKDRSERRLCQRPGCQRPVNGSYTECSMGCRWLNQEIAASQNLAMACGPSDATDRYLIGVKKLARLFDECQQARREIRNAAMQVGVDPDMWQALVRGEYGQPGSVRATG